MNPFEIIRHPDRYGYSWVKGIREKLKDALKDAISIAKEEAEKDDCRKLLTDDGLYECFRQNVDYEEYYANIYVCKYLKMKLDIKYLLWALGGKGYTEHDAEMINFFHDNKTGKMLSRKAYRVEKRITCALYNWEYEHPLREIFNGVESVTHFSDRCFQPQLTRISKILEGEDSISDYLDHYSKMWSKRYFPEVR